MRQSHKMVKHTQTIRRQFADELSVFDHFVTLTLKGLNHKQFFKIVEIQNIYGTDVFLNF